MSVQRRKGLGCWYFDVFATSRQMHPNWTVAVGERDGKWVVQRYQLLAGELPTDLGSFDAAECAVIRAMEIADDLDRQVALTRTERG